MTDPVLELLFNIVRALVDTPQDIKINKVEEPTFIMYYVVPRQGEIGQVIGSKGCLAQSIRSIIKSAARKFGTKNVYMDVVDLSREPF